MASSRKSALEIVHPSGIIQTDDRRMFGACYNVCRISAVDGYAGHTSWLNQRYFSEIPKKAVKNRKAALSGHEIAVCFYYLLVRGLTFVG